MSYQLSLTQKEVILLINGFTTLVNNKRSVYSKSEFTTLVRQEVIILRNELTTTTGDFCVSPYLRNAVSYVPTLEKRL